MNKYVVNILRIIALVELTLGLGLFFKELNEYIHLPTEQLIEEQFGGLVTWFKYKETCYSNLFLYSLMSLTGITCWINIRLYLGLMHVLFITLFCGNIKFVFREFIFFWVKYFNCNVIFCWACIFGDKNIEISIYDRTETI